jgi:amidase
MTFAVVEESLEPNGTTADVISAFNEGVAALEADGATVERVSIPLWTAAWDIEIAVLAFGARVMADSGGAGYFHKGRVDVGTAATTIAQQRTSYNDLAVLSRVLLMAAEHLRDEYLGVHYGKAQNLRLELGKQLEVALSARTALLTPTTPTVANELELRPHRLVEMVNRVARPSVLNTCALDLTGHPAITVPVGADPTGLPVGLQVIGRHFDEATLYRAAAVVEAAGLWRLPEVANAPTLH